MAKLQFNNRGWGSVQAEAGIGLLVAALYVAFLYSLTNFPFSDLPDHLARATIIDDLVYRHGANYGQRFAFEPGFLPYVGGDYLLMQLVRGFGAETAGRLWEVATFLTLPLAVWYLVRAMALRMRAQLIAMLLSFYLASDFFYTTGMFNFRWALALTVAAYAAWLRFRGGPGVAAYGLYVALVVAGYLCHLAAPVLAGAVIGAVSLRAWLQRRQSLAVSAWGLLPIALLLAWYMSRSSGLGLASDTLWRSLPGKVLGLGSSAIRFRAVPDILLFALFLLASGAAGLRSGWRGMPDSARDLAMATAALALLYICLPVATGMAYDIDGRAAAAVAVFLMLTALAGVEPTKTWRQGAPCLAIALVVALGNLAYVAYEVRPQDQALGEYRRVLHSLPANAAWLPIYTLPAIGRYRPFLHADSLAVVDGGPPTPYLFSAANTSFMTYFYFRQPPPTAPPLFWAVDGETPGHWPTVAQAYDFLVITRPYETALIPLATTLHAQSTVSEVLEIVR